MPRRKYPVLWVEDSARFELASVLGPFYASRQFDLTLASDASEATQLLTARQFDAIVMDIRIPPGSDPYWRWMYEDAGADRSNAKLGLAILTWLLRTGDLPVGTATIPTKPEWEIPPSRFGVFSVESRLEVGDQLQGLGIGVFQEKRPGQPETVVLDIVTEVLAAPC